MTAVSEEPIWRVTTASSRGAAHARAGLPNQDAIATWPESGEGPPLILVVSDGHGAAQHFRSDVGARLATEVTVERLREFLETRPDARALAEADRTLPRILIERWRHAVHSHLTAHPFTREELRSIGERTSPTLRREVEEDPYVAYGATLLAIVVARDSMLYLQLGDGDILAVAETGETWRPLPGDALLVANRTTSLCQPNAWEAMRLRADVAPDRWPVLLLASTDGYANSFKTDDDFLQIGRDYLRLVREGGIAPVIQELPGFLAEASKLGSGDDITLGLAARMGTGADEEAGMGDLERRVTTIETRMRELDASIRAARGRQGVALACSLLALVAALIVIWTSISKPNPALGPKGGQPTTGQPKQPASDTGKGSDTLRQPDQTKNTPYPPGPKPRGTH
jgi:hypothetical protein